MYVAAALAPQRQACLHAPMRADYAEVATPAMAIHPPLAGPAACGLIAPFRPSALTGPKCQPVPGPALAKPDPPADQPPRRWSWLPLVSLCGPLVRTKESLPAKTNCSVDLAPM